MRGLKRLKDFFKSDNPELAKNQAVSRTLGLICLAFLIALLTTFLVIPALTSFLGENPPKALEIAVSCFITLITSLLFIRFSWDQVNATVRVAIDVALDEYKKNYSLNEEIKRQHKEFGYQHKAGQQCPEQVGLISS